jgi:hypothetical protein
MRRAGVSRTLVSAPFDLPIYNFATHTRDERVRRVDPVTSIVIEMRVVVKQHEGRPRSLPDEGARSWCMATV